MSNVDPPLILVSEPFGDITYDESDEPGEVSEDDLGSERHDESGLSDNGLSPDDVHETFSDNDLVELEILRDQEIDALVDQRLLPKEDRWNAEHRNGFRLNHPELVLDIVTGDGYPVKPLTYQITNLNLPRVVVDQLRAALRGIHTTDREANSLENWYKRESSDTGCFEFEMAAMHVVAKTVAHLKHFRSDPSYWRSQTALRNTDYELSLERRQILTNHYGIPGLLPDENDSDDPEKATYDPFNPDWSKKVTDLTEEQELVLSNVQHQGDIIDSMFGIDPSSVQGHDLANSILGKTPEEVCAKIPETYRILHIESVVRSDLAGRFLRRQARMRKDLEKLPLNILKGSVKRETRIAMGKRAKEQQILIDHLLSPDLTFHCSREDLVPSIIRQGFLKPTEEKDIRCGATYGQGIYSSPDPTFSLMYTDFRTTPTNLNEFAGLKLIVCATLTGICRYMTRDDNWRNQSVPYPGAHCHAANDLLEYVVFDEAQMIPCYVIHLDLGRDAARYITNLARNPAAYINEYRARARKRRHAMRKLGLGCVSGPGDRQREKQALFAKAQKYFPYGFGAASGSRFVVEDVAEVSEDEEEYGTYQKERIDGAGSAAPDVWDLDHRHTTLALDAEGGSSDGDTGSCDGSGDGEEEEGEAEEDEDGEGKCDWEYEMGPEGRTKFDEYYEARKAKIKKAARTPKRSDW